MKQIQFDDVDSDGLTIYTIFLRRTRRIYRELTSKKRGIVKVELSRPIEDKLSQLIEKTETVFNLLLEEGIQNEYRLQRNVDLILEYPDLSGSTCFSYASEFSEIICNKIMDRGVTVNHINTSMMVPSFKFPDLTVPMMDKEINPHVISHTGKSQVDDYPTIFESSKAKQSLDKLSEAMSEYRKNGSILKRSVHFSTEDIDCTECTPECPTKFKRFHPKNNALVQMIEKNRIGSGGFSRVYKGVFHGQDKAMKCIPLIVTEEHNFISDAVSELEKHMSEIRVQIAASGPGVVIPEACVLQQNQEKDANDKWIAQNFSIFIFPLYDYNLCEFYDKYQARFTDKILADIIHQCFTRNDFFFCVTTFSNSVKLS